MPSGRLASVLLMLACIGPAPSGRADEPKASAPPLARIRVSEDKSHFVLEGSNRRFVLWGFNYDHDDAGRLLEDYWADEWDTVVEDFREMKELGANVVRVHLQTGKFLKSADAADEASLKRLGDLVKLAEATGLYLDLTGLGCYHKQDVPAWYDALDESARWDAQAVFWKAVAGVCKESPAVFCYDLMNEPVLTGGKNPESWLAGDPLGDKYFVQRITTDMKGRKDREIVGAWIERLTSAIKQVDDRTLITVGVIPWAQVFKGAKPLFHDPEVGKSLDFVAVHFYPKAGKLDETLEALKVYEVGKPLVIEEIFPLGASLEETETFIERSKSHVDGWVSFYWGKTIAECEKTADIPHAVTAAWLKRLRDLAPADSRP
ncbi:cellulase family glycosylhydrolase [Planctomyces sp. SH-PL62]|uniref:cellulase family glycosylhydrolase n=1 Tax=Planctomyces sp. SH-PL62 TaxID=1636152 RepID=UPI00078E7F30|nr:cellulase family glycosylhydrolase [Planctomyces sp. SH-PL62]AMV40535.1 Cellulase (glycosyl hydrolase family 5) [Planctomyces sp. SH-PL62]